MKAVAYKTPGTIDRADSLVDIEQEVPMPSPRDLLVEVKAISVNPVDTKVRANVSPEPDGWKVLGWDAAGIVKAVGDGVEGFKPGDEVWYSGELERPGTNAEYHLVDERLVSHKPKSLGFAEAAALPLTSVTAWEMLFERLEVERPVTGAANAILIIGGAGGVGSIAIQLLRALTDLTVIATASRPETREWVERLGAHAVIDHSQPLAAQVESLGLGAPGFVFSTTHSERHKSEVIELIAPQGRYGLIDDPEQFVIDEFKRKSISIHWELMYTRSLFKTSDMNEQGSILNRVAELVDEGRVKTTVTETMGPINAENLKQAHALLESSRARGKVVLEGF
ncbi:zinc-binding alcohol dehydrogenase family protein [Salinicola peritrichatus]|uniref:zinc-binding alcohol dehydrogenase family protein n=1 Tax=Salinicola peritrichatus TaxID=1267424 RepID=UPI000DA2628C|nr:zinc-binding alcohol dehydrogenase family protein [Salinicola peritrichatus]